MRLRKHEEMQAAKGRRERNVMASSCRLPCETTRNHASPCKVYNYLALLNLSTRRCAMRNKLLCAACSPRSTSRWPLTAIRESVS
jgi:hypothetical protein